MKTPTTLRSITCTAALIVVVGCSTPNPTSRTAITAKSEAPTVSDSLRVADPFAEKIAGSKWRVEKKRIGSVVGPSDVGSFDFTLLGGGRVDIKHGTLRGSWEVKGEVATVSLIAKWPLSGSGKGKDVTWYTGVIDASITHIKGEGRSEVGGFHTWSWEASRRE